MTRCYFIQYENFCPLTGKFNTFVFIVIIFIVIFGLDAFYLSCFILLPVFSCLFFQVNVWHCSLYNSIFPLCWFGSCTLLFLFFHWFSIIFYHAYLKTCNPKLIYILTFLPNNYKVLRTLDLISLSKNLL